MTMTMLIRELDRLYLKARETNEQGDWTAYLVLKATIDRLMGKGAK